MDPERSSCVSPCLKGGSNTLMFHLTKVCLIQSLKISNDALQPTQKIYSNDALSASLESLQVVFLFGLVGVFLLWVVWIFNV